MRARVKSLGVLVSALLVTCLLGWPEEAKKGPDKAVVTNPEINGANLLFPPGFDRLYDKIYYDTKGTASKPPQATAAPAAGEPKKSSPLSLRLYGGYSRLSPADMNEGVDFYFELLELYAANGGGSTSGGYSPLNSGINFGADLIFQLTPKIGVGIGAGYLQSSKTSQMTATLTSAELEVTGTPKLSAMPIRLALFLTFPIGGKLSLTADAGAAVYAGLKLDASQRVENNIGAWETTSLKASRTSLSANLGFQGSLGIDYAFSQKMGFFIEAVARYARFKNFAQATEISEFSGGTPETDEGKIYLETNTIEGIGSYSWFIISAAPPIDEPPYTVYREPKFDLSGFSLQAGIRIRF